MLNLTELSLRGDALPIRVQRPASAGTQAFAALRHAIITLKLQPGQPFSEQEVAQQLGVSRTPVREAFIKLAEAGLVEVLPQRGSFVRKISLKAVRDARFVREAIELAVLREAIGRRLSPAFFTTTRELLAAQRVAAASHDAERFLTLDEEFHRSFALAIDCSHAWTVIEAQKAQMDRVRFLSLPSATPVARLIDQHEVILDAVERGDVAASEAAMRTHLSEVLAVLEPLCQLHPDLFEQDGR
jgi:GntR family transcriptional regulator, rspAB operon transcriptional repressor